MFTNTNQDFKGKKKTLDINGILNILLCFSFIPTKAGHTQVNPQVAGKIHMIPPPTQVVLTWQSAIVFTSPLGKRW